MIANPTYQEAERRGRRQEQLLAALLALFAMVATVSAGLLGIQVVLIWAQTRYEGRIHPNVYAIGVALGGLKPEEAEALLRGSTATAEAPVVVFHDGESQWAVSWPQAGIGPDLAATVDAALSVGRSEGDALTRAVSWLERHDVQPVLAVDLEQARVALREVGARTAIPPVEATLRLEGAQLIAVPGRSGRALDVDVTLAVLATDAARRGPEARIQLIFTPVAPSLADASPLLPQATELVSRRLELAAYDVLTDETFTWSLAGPTIASWLRLEASGPDGPTLRVDGDAVRATLAGLAAEMGGGRGLRLDEAVAQVQATLGAGGGAAQLYLTHPAATYTVQPGDTFDAIAVNHGLPPVVLAEANPDLHPNILAVGQALVIPSPDTLLPRMPVPHKRVIISIGRQRMQVYENGALLYDWPVSTGIASSPTLPGTFQVLEKVENAYASRWSLWMPHFLAIYQAGPDFYNGIHALPINANGVRLWAGLLGRPASYGCIILGVDQAATLYDWAEVGVPVVIER